MLYNLFHCDAWHTNSSMAHIGTFDEQHKAVFKSIEISKDQEEGLLTEHDIYLLNTIAQTQGRSENFIIQTTNLNE